jgi:outer membrane protein OmpA-like peptidoglycan-associated protein
MTYIRICILPFFVLAAFCRTAVAQTTAVNDAWAKYDFIPGSPLLFYDNFSGDQSGRPPIAWKVIEGKAEVIEFEKHRWLRAINASFVAPQVQNLPGRFTLEMEFYVTPRGYSGNYRVDVYGQTDQEWAALTIEDVGAYFNTSWGLSLEYPLELKGRHRLAMMSDGSGFTCYIDSLRVAEVAKAGKFQAKDIEIFMPGGEKEGDDKSLITNFRLAANQSFREQIDAQKKIVSYGFVFGKEETAPRPESTPTLKALAALLQADLGLNLSIECHTYETDDAGDNARLSQKRAEALKEILVRQYKIDQDRLSTKGWGASRPLRDDETVESLAANPRVEFVER